MKYLIQVINNNVTSNLKFHIDEKSICFTLVKDCDINLHLKDNYREIVFIVQDGVKVNLVNTIGNGNTKLSYSLANNSFMSEFVLIENDDENIVVEKHVKQLNDSVYEVTNGLFSDSNVKCDVVVDLDGVNAKALHNIAVIARKENEKYFNITINNNEKMSYGELNNFGVVKDTATLIFNGTGYIKKGATLSEAHQESKIITFDPKIKAQANPFLIIDESDVKASHAAAVGKIDEEQLYYLQSRGIRYNDASKLITYGYLKPVLNKVSDEALKERLEKLIESKVGI